MAGRKPPTPGLWSQLLDKIGFPTSPKKGKKGKRKKGGRPAGTTRLDPAALGDPALDAIVNAPIPTAGPEPSPFAQYGAESGMGFADAMGYEAAAAAGYAPASEPVAATSLPFAAPDRFAPAPPPPPPPPAVPIATTPIPPLAAPPTTVPQALPGKLFNEDALDRSLDALFSGLESGLAAPSLGLVDDRPPQDLEVAYTPPPAPPPTPEPRVRAADGVPAGHKQPEERPKPPPPIKADGTTMPPPMPVASTPPASVFATPAADPHPTSRREPSQLPPPRKLELASNVDLRGLLAAIDRAPGVAGSMVVGYDGLIIVSSLPHDTRDYLGAAATSLFAGTGSQLEKMKRGELQRLLLESAGGSMLMTSADMGILVVVSQDGRPMDVTAVMTSIAGALGLG